MATTSLSPASSFQKALDKFKSKSGLTLKELEDMEMTTLPDLQKALDAMQKKQQASRSMKHLRRLQPFLDAMKQYSKVVDVFANTSDFVAFVWGPMKFLLTVAYNFSDAFNALLDGYLTIGENIPLLEQYRQLFESNEYMKVALASIFEDLMDFHLEAVKLFKQKAWKQLYHATWRGLSKNIEEITKSLQRHKGIIERQATLVEYEQFQEFRAQTKAEFAKLQLAERDRRYFFVQRWLCPIDSRARDEAAGRERFPDTGLWLLQNQCFQDWFAPDRCMDPLLWLCGMPGAGKTVLASLTVSEVRKLPDALSLCFYCKHTDDQRNGFLAVAKSLISQILPTTDCILDYVYEEASKSGEATLSTLALAKTLLEVALKSCKRVYIVLDGLDEYSREDRKELTSWVQKLIIGLPRDDFGSIRCLFVSQEDGYARKDLSMLSKIKITHLENKSDIDRFCEYWHRKIEDKFGPLEERHHHVANVVSARAQGMFLFAKLVTWNLHEQTSRADFEAEIDEVPNDIDKAYDRILDRLVAPTVPKTRRDNIRKLLGWLACARRPLKWHEIQGAVTVDLDEGVISAKQKFQEDCKDLCQSLVEISSDHTVTLVHSTTKPYLIRKGFFHGPKIECGMATLTLTYLSLPEFESNRGESDVQYSYLRGAYAFADYAICFWALHVESAFADVSGLDADELKVLIECLETFLALHWVNPATSEMVSTKVGQRLKALEPYEFHHQACQAVATAKGWLRPASKPPDADTSLRLPQITGQLRTKFEVVSSSGTLSDEQRELILQYYGSKHYKCSRMNCQFFHQGFSSHSQRDEHTAKHDRSFICVFSGCPYEIIGFPTRKELEKHTFTVHGIKTDSDELEFPEDVPFKPSRQKHVATHECTICLKKFTRRSILNAHLRSHANERPYTCLSCGKAFARLHDRNRHRELHNDTKNFVCGQYPRFEGGQPWGCGREFTRTDSLGLHLKSQAGRACLHQMLAEKRAEAVREQERRQAELRRDDLTTVPDFSDSNFNLDFSSLENSDVLENFDFDSFLNTSTDETWNFEANDPSLLQSVV